MADSSQAQPDDSLRVEELAALVRQQTEAIQGLKEQLSRQIKREIANTTQQLEAHQALQALIGDLPASQHGWPISPDFALQVVRLIRDHAYDLIVEFGSGTSSYVWMRALEQFNLHSAVQEGSPHRLITFEHLNDYHQKTTDLVTSLSNRLLLDLRLSPLEPWEDATGSYSYYAGTADISEAIQHVAALVQRPLKLLVVIDGPPSATCHWARYPAVPILLDAASGMDLSIDFVLDDMIRSDEKDMALAWEQQLQAFGVHYQRVDYSFEKSGLLLSLNSLAGIDTSLVRSEALATDKREQEAIAAAVARVDELLSELEAVKQDAAMKKREEQQAVEELKQQLEAKTAELQTLASERDVRTKETAEAQQQLADLNQQLEAKTAELQTLAGERDVRTKETAVAQEQVADLNQQLEARAGQLQTLTAERDAQTKETAVAQQQLADLNQQLEARAGQLQTLTAERDAQTKETAAAQQQVAELTQQLEAKTADLQTVATERDAQAKEKAEAHQTVEELRNQLDETQKLLEVATSSLSNKSLEAQTASEEAELTHLQLHQVQEELEQVFLADQQKAAALQDVEKETHNIKSQLEESQKQLREATNSLSDKSSEAQTASEEAELTLLQLHQVQEELEHYFLKSKSSDELAEAQSQQLSRSQSLLSRLIQQPGLELQSIRSVDVEVLPPDNTQLKSAGPVQTEALLDSYKTSLQRATDLLKQKI